MATLEQESKLRESVKTILNDILSKTPESLIRQESLGTELSFERGLPYFERVFSLLSSLGNCDLSRMPYSSLNSTQNILTEINDLITSIENFSAASTSNPGDTRNNYIKQFNENYDRWFSVISPIIAFSVREGTDFQSLQKQANDIISQMEKYQKQAIEIGDKQNQSLNQILESVRRAAAEVGVAQHATHFQDEASAYKSESKTWLIWSAGFAAATAIWGLFSFHILQSSSASLNDITFIQTMIERFSVLLILFISTIWCSKNYAAARHNYVINKHRQNALSTFETFVKAAGEEDIQTKNAVLLQATQCIFSPQPTGFSNKSTDVESPTKIIEIAKDISKASK